MECKNRSRFSLCVYTKDDITFHVMTRFPLCAAHLKKACIELKICWNESNINVIKWFFTQTVLHYIESVKTLSDRKWLILVTKPMACTTASLFVVLNNSPTEMSNMTVLGNWQNFINAKKPYCKLGLLEKIKSDCRSLYHLHISIAISC